MNTQINKCINNCNTEHIELLCRYINQYYTCSHYCCYRTTLETNWCIACGNYDRSNYKPPLPPKCKTCHGNLPDNVSKMCNYCEDVYMYEEDKYGFLDDDEATDDRRNINNYSYKQLIIISR